MTELETLIRKHLSENRIDLAIYLCEALKSQRDRAELSRDAYLHEVKLLAEKFAKLNTPIEKIITETTFPSRPRNVNPKSQSHPDILSDLEL